MCVHAQTSSCRTNTGRSDEIGSSITQGIANTESQLIAAPSRIRKRYGGLGRFMMVFDIVKATTAPMAGRNMISAPTSPGDKPRAIYRQRETASSQRPRKVLRSG